MNVYICVEIASREMIFKKYIKNILNENNFKCVLGFSDDIIDGLISGKLSSGIIIVKSIQIYTLPKLVFLRLSGNKIVYMEEEAWVPLNDEDILRRRFPKITYKLCSAVFSPNKYYYDLISTVPFTSKQKIFNVGSKRMSSKKEFNVSKFKTILFLGSYGVLTSEKRFLDFLSHELGFIDKYRLRKKYKKYFVQYKDDKLALFKLMNTLAKDKNLKVSYRPHPSEKNIILDNNIKLATNKTPIVEICKDHDLIIHSGSTSTFEIPTGKVLCYSSEKSNDILQNSKFHGPIAHTIDDIYKICKSNFKCIYNDFYFVNKFDENIFINTLKEINVKPFKPFKLFINFIYKFYLETISPFRRKRNKILIDHKRKRFNEF